VKKLVIIALALSFIAPAAAQAAKTFEYDALGRLTKVTTSTGAVVTYSYDAADNRTTVVATAATNPPPSSTFKVVVVPLNGFTVIPIPN
jgi:YD repeat-containing protein